ncbi:MAG: ATP-binding protein [Prevotella sp.]
MKQELNCTLVSQFLLTLCTVLAVLATPATVFAAQQSAQPHTPKADNIFSAYDDAKNKPAAANKIYSLLRKENYTDENPHFDRSTPRDTIDRHVWYMAAYYHFDHADFAKAIEAADKLLALCRNNLPLTAEIQNLVAICHFWRSEYTEAIVMAEKSLRTYRKIGGESDISSTLNTIAGIYLAAHKPEEAQRYITEAIAHSTAAGDSARMAIQYGMASEIHHALHDDKKARDYALKAFIIDSIGGREPKMGIRLSQLAEALMSLGEKNRAEAALRRALPILHKYGILTSAVICHNQLGNLMLEKNRRAEAEQEFTTAQRIAAGYHDLYSESNSLYGLYRTLAPSRPAEALRHLARYAALRDSIYKKEMRNALMEHDAKYRNGELELANQKARLRNIITLTIALTVIFVLILVIIFLIVRRYRQAARRELMKSKVRFFTQVTHEFRTPLTVIRAAAESLLKDYAKDSQGHTDLCCIIYHEERLLELINQILETGRLTHEQNVPHPKAVNADIVGMVAMTCERYTLIGAARGVKISFSAQPQEVEMDFIPDYMSKIMQNLISNAIKYSPSGNTVEVRTLMANGRLHIVVKDGGKGMEPEEIKKIFTPFYRDNNVAPDHGTGIGLPLVKLCAEAMGGTVEVESVPGRGTTVTVSLPIHHACEKAVADDMEQAMPYIVAENADDIDDGRKRVLIVEDTPEVARFISRQLGERYAYRFAHDGTEGLEMAEKYIPDLIITDVMMPGIDGLQLCQKVRESELLCHIPVIMVTAKITHEDRLAGLEAGADAYLEKPFSSEELNLRVEKLLEQLQRISRKFSTDIVEGTKPGSIEISAADREFIDKCDAAMMEAIHRGKVDYYALAYELCISRAQLNRKVKAITGCTTTEYILKLRMRLATEFLDNSDLPVWEVALKCGMDNPTYFGILFKRTIGMTPQQYRNRNKT